MLFGITGFMLGGIRFILIGIILVLFLYGINVCAGNGLIRPESSFTYRLYVETM